MDHVDAETSIALPAPFIRWFAEKGWRPRAHQLELLARAEAGESTLLIAPTGAGKTLAGFLPALTDLTRRGRRQVEGLHERVLARTPANRWGTPADFAGIAVFLASAASDFITGAAIPVDGGYSSQG